MKLFCNEFLIVLRVNNVSICVYIFEFYIKIYEANGAEAFLPRKNRLCNLELSLVLSLINRGNNF